MILLFFLLASLHHENLPPYIYTLCQCFVLKMDKTRNSLSEWRWNPPSYLLNYSSLLTSLHTHKTLLLHYIICSALSLFLSLRVKIERNYSTTFLPKKKTCPLTTISFFFFCYTYILCCWLVCIFFQLFQKCPIFH